MLGISVSKLYRICEFFDSDPDDAWDLIEGEFFEYEPGQARKRRFYEEGVMAIAKYLEETEGGSFLARLKEFFTHHRARVTRALVQRRIIQVTQDRSTLVIKGDLVFLQQRSVVRVLGTNGKGMNGTLRRIEEERSSLSTSRSIQNQRRLWCSFSTKLASQNSLRTTQTRCCIVTWIRTARTDSSNCVRF